MAYSTCAQVATLCQNLIQGASTFSSSTSPTDTAVGTWLSSGCSIIETRLAGWRYSVPVTAGTVAYDMVADLNALYGAAKAEMSRSNVTLQPGERTRGQVFMDLFWKQLKDLRDMDLTMAGLARSSTGGLYAGGISQADKDSITSDSDRVSPRFQRGIFRTDGTLDPSGVVADTDVD